MNSLEISDEQEAAMLSRLKTTFKTPHVTKALDLFAHVLSLYEGEAQSPALRRYARSFALVQSSGYGKSALLFQLASWKMGTRHMLFMLSFNLRSNMVFPRRDSFIAEWFYMGRTKEFLAGA
ncbi:unnamed protein product [Sympodiomycopsis kandeliae]